MNSIVRICALGLALAVMGQPATAESRLAILIANERYDTLRRATGADEILSLEQSLEANDFRVLTFENVSVKKLKELMADVPELIENADRTLIAVSGHIARTDRESWLLATDAGQAGAGVIGMEGLALNALSDILGMTPGSAALLIGAPRRMHDVGAGTEAGYSPVNIAQGVSVFFGPVDTLTAWAEAEFLNGNRTVA
ncbi:MAG: caspase family protein, partial [Paracoccaceae bacterium]|nr:caspase family protein [Paracoccaceae bacterium]